MPIELEPKRTETTKSGIELPRMLFIFLISGSALWLMAGNLFVLGLDEGIYLQGGARILSGQVPYRDFFALTGPGTFWLEAAAMKIFGISLAAGRAVMVLDVAILTAIVYWLVAQLAGRRRLAVGAALVFFAFETGLSFRLYANHRWDSGALALAAIAAAFSGTRRPRASWFFAAGFLAAAADWCTPSLLLLLIAFALWTLTSRELRKYTLALIAGTSACSLLAAVPLAFEHALVPMIHDMLWAAVHYEGPNHVYYGYGVIPHGEGLIGVFAGARGAELLIRILDFFLTLVPPALPIVIYVAWLLRTRKGTAAIKDELRPVLLLLVSSAAMLLSTYPRWSADQLMFVTPVFYVLAAFLFGRILRGQIQKAVGTSVLVLAIVALGVSVSGLRREPSIKTRVGRIRAVPQDQELIAALDSVVPRGSSLFVYPYLPVLYFLTQTVNSTSYDFLQPGMMTARDGETVLDELRDHPPEYVVYFEFPAPTFFGIWPHANPNRTRFPEIEKYLRENYRLVKDVFHPVAEFAILERNEATRTASQRRGHGEGGSKAGKAQEPSPLLASRSVNHEETPDLRESSAGRENPCHGFPCRAR